MRGKVKRAFKVDVPLVNGGKEQPKVIAEKLKHQVLKPERVLGAPFIEKEVAHARGVALCEECWRKYYGWWERENYRPDWDLRWLSACDGCSRVYQICVLFLPEVNFFRVLSQQTHGRKASPKKRIYTNEKRIPHRW